MAASILTQEMKSALPSTTATWKWPAGQEDLQMPLHGKDKWLLDSPFKSTGILLKIPPTRNAMEGPKIPIDVIIPEKQKEKILDLFHFIPLSKFTDSTMF